MIGNCFRSLRLAAPVAGVVLTLTFGVGCGRQSSSEGKGAPESVQQGGNEVMGSFARFGRGFLVWESNRSSGWRIWRRDFDGEPARMITPDEDGRDHFCPHISPDGRRIVYLSYASGTNAYDHAAMGRLELLEESGRVRTVLDAARSYREDRAAVWIDNRTVCAIDGTGGTVAVNVDSGERQSLLANEAGGYGWLINVALAHATTGQPRFAQYADKEKAVVGGVLHAGCQPYFTRDGRWGFWIGGAGGPVNRIHLASGHFDALLERTDARLVDDWTYLYFPMISACQSLMVFGASQGGHDHFEADYEIFLVEIDTNTLEPVADAVRCTFSPACDRFPDVWRERPALGMHTGEGRVRKTFAPQETGHWFVGGREIGERAQDDLTHSFDNVGLHEVRFLPAAEGGWSKARGLLCGRQSRLRSLRQCAARTVVGPCILMKL